MFVQLVIKNWELQSLSGGFRNTTLKAGLVAAADGSRSWGSSVDKQMGITPKTLLRFKVGVVPFELGFDVPVAIQAEVDASGAVHAKLGATGSIAIADTSLTW